MTFYFWLKLWLILTDFYSVYIILIVKKFCMWWLCGEIEMCVLSYLYYCKGVNQAVQVISILTTQQPSYLANIIRFRAASRQLRSCGRNLLHDDRTNLAFADRAFSHATPAVWNTLPPEIVSNLSCLATFKRLVKTELYNQAYLRWFVTTRTYDCEWL